MWRVTGPQPREAMTTLAVVSVVAVCVAFGAARGLWMSNLHNAGIAIGFSVVGAFVLTRRPGHGEGRLFLLLGFLSALIYVGRQIGLDTDSAAGAWWGWIGVWPTALAIALTTWVMLCFPEGRFLSPRWRMVAIGGAAAASFAALLSALWPVEYENAGVSTPYPFELPGGGLAGAVWSVLAPPTYIALQVLWIVGMVARWRASDSVVRRQLVFLIVAIAATLAGLLVGLALWGTPAPGLLLIVLIPIVAGWLIDRISLAHVVEVERAAGHLDELSPRENDVLDLMAQGRSNTAIAGQLHLSIKTVEPAISSIFRKLGLDDNPASNRRVMAVAEYWSRQR